MRKKKLILSATIILLLGLFLWAMLPFICPSQNLITKNCDDYICCELTLIDREKINEPIIVRQAQANIVTKIISILDDLSYKRTKVTLDTPLYRLELLGNLNEKTDVTIPKSVIIINFYEDNIIELYKSDQYKSIFYKILDEDFDIKESLEDLL